MTSTRIPFEHTARSASGLAPSQHPDTQHDTLLRAASAHRAQVRNPFAATPKSFPTRLGHALLADTFAVAGTCRPSRLIGAGLEATFGARPAPAAPTHRAHRHPSASERFAAGACLLSAFLGTVIDFAMDAAVLSVVLTLALPAIVVHAICAALASQGLHIDTQHISAYDVEMAYNKAVRSGVREHVLGKETDGIAEQFKKDFIRQTMYISAGPDDALVPLEQDYNVAMAKIGALCTDEQGVVDRAFLWAVTDMSAQGLLNEVYRELMQRQAVTYEGNDTAPNFNGDTAHAVRKLSADAVAVRGQMLMPKGLQVAILGGAHAGGFPRDPTPMRLDVEVVVYQGCKEHPMPRVHVTELRLAAL